MIEENKKTIRNFYRLEVWKDAHILTIEIYKITTIFPKKETMEWLIK